MPSFVQNEFREKTEYIPNQVMCGPIVIRNGVMRTSAEYAPMSIDDCDITAWNPEALSVDYDDARPVAVGSDGTQRLTRKAVVGPNTCGLKCPASWPSENAITSCAWWIA